MDRREFLASLAATGIVVVAPESKKLQAAPKFKYADGDMTLDLDMASSIEYNIHVDIWHRYRTLQVTYDLPVNVNSLLADYFHDNRRIRVQSKVHDIDEYAYIDSMSYSIHTPHMVEIDLNLHMEEQPGTGRSRSNSES